MHIVHLAIAADCVTSCLLDWSDDQSYFEGRSREQRLTTLWHSYRSWCESQEHPLGERAQRKLFTTAILKTDQYVEVSQKILKAAAARYMMFWVESVAKQIAASTHADLDMYRGSHRLHFFMFPGKPVFCPVTLVTAAHGCIVSSC